MLDPREEFISEAQEIIEGFSRDLLNLDHSLKLKGPQQLDHELVNDTFRAVHTLKGLAGFIGLVRMSALSHRLEDILDGLRLGRMTLEPRVLDILFRAVDVYNNILSALRDNQPEPQEIIDEFLAEVEASLVHPEAVPADPFAGYELDPELINVLTEYEEHRLRSNLEHGLLLYKIRVSFELTVIDQLLEEFKTKAKPFGEIVTYLPSTENLRDDAIDLDVLFVSSTSLDVLIRELSSPTTQIEAVSRRVKKNNRHTKPPSQPHVASVRSKEAQPITHAPPPIEYAVPPIAVAPLAREATAKNQPTINSSEEEASSELSAMGSSIRGVAQTVRVDIRKLDHLMNVVAELTIVRTTLQAIVERTRKTPQLQSVGTELFRLHRSFERQLTHLQTGILEVRMVPLGQVFDKLARVVRRLSRQQNKEINLVITGGETEIDKLIVEELSDPLMHMIRNALDHGIEAHEVRLQHEKPAAGTIALNAYQKGNHVVIEVQDDGAGIDQEKVIRRAIQRGLVNESEAQRLTQREIIGFIFLPGFTTKEGVDELSGRGVGMDVVKTNLAKVGGIVDVSTELGIGTQMTITLPITLAIIRALLVTVAGRRFAIPLSSVLEVMVFNTTSVHRIEGREVLTLRETTLPLCFLDRLFRLSVPTEAPSIKRRYVVVIGVAHRRIGCIVDRLVGQQDIVLKALGESLRSVRGLAGAAELGDQTIGLVIDTPSIIEETLVPNELNSMMFTRTPA